MSLFEVTSSGADRIYDDKSDYSDFCSGESVEISDCPCGRKAHHEDMSTFCETCGRPLKDRRAGEIIDNVLIIVSSGGGG